MKKKFRLLKDKDFKKVINNQKKIFTDSLTCYFYKDKSIDNIQLSIIIPKKKCKRAVDRNYLKRLFWYINQNQTLNTLPKFKCVFFFSKNFLDTFFSKNTSVKKLEFDVSKTYQKLIRLANSNDKSQ